MTKRTQTPDPHLKSTSTISVYCLIAYVHPRPLIVHDSSFIVVHRSPPPPLPPFPLPHVRALPFPYAPTLPLTHVPAFSLPPLPTFPLPHLLTFPPPHFLAPRAPKMRQTNPNYARRPAQHLTPTILAPRSAPPSLNLPPSPVSTHSSFVIRRSPLSRSRKFLICCLTSARERSTLRNIGRPEAHVLRSFLCYSNRCAGFPAGSRYRDTTLFVSQEVRHDRRQERKRW